MNDNMRDDHPSSFIGCDIYGAGLCYLGYVQLKPGSIACGLADASEAGVR